MCKPRMLKQLLKKGGACRRRKADVDNLAMGLELVFAPADSYGIESNLT